MQAIIKKRIISDVVRALLVVTSMLLAGASQAETVILDENNNAIQIKNLEVVLDQGGSTVFDVDFVYDTGFNVYGALLELPFTEEDAANVQIQVNEALNANNPVPTGAGPVGSNQHFVGADQDPLTGLIGGVGGEYFSQDGEWDKCDTDCILGVKPLDPSSSYTYAVFGPPGSSGNLPPTADAGGPYTGIVGNAVSFDGSASDDPDGTIASYGWDFGDGNSDVGETPTNTYTTAGVYDVTLTVTDDSGTPDSAETVAVIGTGNRPPAADAGGPYIGTTGVAVSFDGSASSDGDGTIVTWDWDFGDGSAPGSGEMVTHTYAADGAYAVILTVTDDSADTDSDQAAAVIGAAAQPPVADAGGPYTGTVGIAVSFDGTGSSDADGNIVTWDWDFGDGSAPGSGETTTHTYAVAGQYNVILTVTDDDSASDSTETSADIGDSGDLPPVADAGGPYTGAPGVAVNFDGTGSSDPGGDAIISYTWDFGDGSPLDNSGAAPSHVYTTNGVYNVTLTVTDAAGTPDSNGTVAIIRPESDLGIGQVTISPNPVLINELFAITIPIDNGGPSDEPAATASITLPANITFGTATPTQGTCSESMGVIDCDLGPIASGDSVTISVTGDAPPQTGPLTIGVTADGQNFDPDPGNVTASFNFDAVAAVSVQAKAKGGGAFGMIGLLLLALATIPRLSRKIRQTSFAVFLSAGVLCGLMLGAPNISQAQDWYVGAGGGATDIDSDTSRFANDMTSLGHTVSNVNIDDSGEGWKVFGGYNINEYFAAEAAYVDLGDVTASFDGVSLDPPQMLADAAELLPVTADGFSIAALGRYPFGERGAIFAKVGAYFWESDIAIDITGGSVTGSSNPSTDGTDVVYGVGGDLYIGDNFGLRLEWERYALGPNDVDLVSASVLLRF